MKITRAIENIFSHAVALEQKGGFRNTIYVYGKEIFILNYDHTVLLRFRLRESEVSFKNEISFHANDYDSDQFYEENGKIVFVNEKEGFQRKKSCGIPGITFKEVKNIFLRYNQKSKDKENESINFPKELLELLDLKLVILNFFAKKEI